MGTLRLQGHLTQSYPDLSVRGRGFSLSFIPLLAEAPAQAPFLEHLRSGLCPPDVPDHRTTGGHSRGRLSETSGPSSPGSWRKGRAASQSLEPKPPQPLATDTPASPGELSPLRQHPLPRRPPTASQTGLNSFAPHPAPWVARPGQLTQQKPRDQAPPPPASLAPKLSFCCGVLCVLFCSVSPPLPPRGADPLAPLPPPPPPQGSQRARS